jgi:hypothetical protein
MVIRYEPLEAHVEALVLARLERDADLQPDEDDPTDALREKIAAVEARLTVLADAFADDGGDVLEFRRVGMRYREQIVELRRQIATAATRKRLADPVEIRAQWPGYDLSQRRAIVTTLIERVVVAPGRVGLNRFDAERLRVIWR